MCGTKVVAACIFNKLQAAGLFLALEGTSMRTKPSTRRKYGKSANNAAFFCNEILFVVSAAGTSTLQLEHTPMVATQHMPCGLYELSNVMLYGKYHWRVY